MLNKSFARDKMKRILNLCALALLFLLSISAHARTESIFLENMKVAMKEDNAPDVTPYGSLYAVSEKNGNIFITDKKGQTKQLTFSGKDSQPSLSPDEKTVVFVRNTPDKKIKVNMGQKDEVEANEIWIIDADGKNPKLVIEAGKESLTPKGMEAHRLAKEKGIEAPKGKELTITLAKLSSPQFSPDGKLLYFMSMRWVTSDAIHIMNLNNKFVCFVTDGNSLEVIKKGKYTGHLIVKKHRYFLGGGSYDWFYLLSNYGIENAPLGETDKNFKDMYVK